MGFVFGRSIVVDLRFDENLCWKITSRSNDFKYQVIKTLFVVVVLLLLTIPACCLFSAISIPLIFGVSAATMWSAMTIFGFALAPCFPSMFNCLESHMHLAGVHASLLSIGSALGEMIIPMSMSLVFRRYTLAALIWCLLASISAGVLFLGATLVVARCVDRYQSGHQHIPLSAMGDIDNEIQFSDDDEI